MLKFEFIARYKEADSNASPDVINAAWQEHLEEKQREREEKQREREEKQREREREEKQREREREEKRLQHIQNVLQNKTLASNERSEALAAIGAPSGRFSWSMCVAPTNLHSRCELCGFMF
jgi:hypothetical protein